MKMPKLPDLPKLTLPKGGSVHTWINTLSIPLFAGILIWVLNRVLDPNAWCSAQSEMTTIQSAQVAAQELFRCNGILIQQLKTGHLVAIGLVAALSLAHLVSVVRDVKAEFGLSSKFGTFNIGGDGSGAAVAGAEHVADAADRAAEELKELAPPAQPAPGPEVSAAAAAAGAPRPLPRPPLPPVAPPAPPVVGEVANL